jgi:hypothetical protein
MTGQDELITKVIAEADAVHLPLRAHQWAGRHAGANAYIGRKLYLTTGIPLRSGQGAAAARMAFGRLVAATARAGLATVRRLRSVRWPYLRLTDAGDAKARALAGLAQVDATVELLREILRQQVEHPGPGGWVSEFWLADDGRDMHELRAIEAMALPGLWRGWLEAAWPRSRRARTTPTRPPRTRRPPTCTTRRWRRPSTGWRARRRMMGARSG